MARVFIGGFEDAFHGQICLRWRCPFSVGCLGATVAALSDWLASELRQFVESCGNSRLSDDAKSPRSRMGEGNERPLPLPITAPKAERR